MCFKGAEVTGTLVAHVQQRLYIPQEVGLELLVGVLHSLSDVLRNDFYDRDQLELYL